MYEKYNVSNRDLSIFFVVTFGLTIIMVFFMSRAYSLNLVEGYPLVQMYYPALGAMVTILLNKETKEKIPKEFFGVYIFFSITSIIYLLIKTIILKQDLSSQLNIWLIIGSISLVIVQNADKEKNIEFFGLKFGKNQKMCFFYLIIFIMFYLASMGLSSLLFGELVEFIAPFKKINTWIAMILLPFSFSISFILFLGDEYGWRYFLQSALQERLGKRMGVIVLGLIWGIWHFPINLFYYSPETSFYSVLNQLIMCTCYSVFFGLVYMKTKNIWGISMIHFVNNNLGHLLYGGTGTNLVFTWKAVLSNLIIFSLFYLPFLFTKEYRIIKNVKEI